MSKSLLDPFYFNKNERKGIFILISFLVFLFSYQIFLSRKVIPKDVVISEIFSDDLEMDTYKMQSIDNHTAESKLTFQTKEDLIDNKLTSKSKSKNSKNNVAQVSFQSFDFNPNTISKDSLQLLGITSPVIQNWLKYRQAGGKFYTVDHLSKIYGMDSLTLDRIRNSVVFRLTDPKKKRSKTKAKKLIELNSASAEELISLKGIGPVLSERIIKFRNALGGFYKIEQIKEVYGLEESVYQSILPMFKLFINPEKININTVPEKELSKHPYVNKKQAKQIVRYRNMHGPFHSPNDLLDMEGIDSLLIKRIYPYLSI